MQLTLVKNDNLISLPSNYIEDVNQLYVVSLGSFTDGFKFYGVFMTHESAELWLRNNEDELSRPGWTGQVINIYGVV